MVTQILARALCFFFLLFSLNARSELGPALNYLALDKYANNIHEIGKGNLQDQWQSIKHTLSGSTNLLKNILKRITETVRDFFADATHENCAVALGYCPLDTEHD
ncbi:MAG TPA: hypothetical protein VEK06_00155 [Myxococcota bacterium]|nr:hypothetical protein [Myxococcota bacterium]